MDLREESTNLSNDGSVKETTSSSSSLPLPSIASRIKRKTVESMKYQGVGLLRQVLLEEEEDTNNTQHSSSLKYIIDDFTYQELESYPLKLYVVLTFFDRFLCWNNTAKYESWFRPKFASSNFDEEAFLNSRVFWPLSLEHELAADLHQELFGSNSWFPEFLKRELNLIAVPVEETLQQENNNNRIIHHHHGLTLQNVISSTFLTYREFFRIRSEQIISVLNKPDILRFDEITELHCLLNVQLILDLVKGHNILPNDGKDFEHLQVVPRGKTTGNLFISSDDEASWVDVADDESSSLLDFDTAFHTQSSDFLILFPSITDLTNKHYERLLHRSKKGVTLKNHSDTNKNDETEIKFEYARLIGDQALVERTPYVTFFPRFLVTMSHEVNHITQGIVNHVDTSHYKMASEHDPSVFETIFSYLVAKKYSSDEQKNHQHQQNLTFLFPRGLAELSATVATERHHFILTRVVDSFFLPHYEEFLMSYGLHQMEPVIREKIALDEKENANDDDDDEIQKSDHQNESCKNQESAWAVANYFAYCQTAHFTKNVEEVRALMKLTFGPKRWHAKLYDEENMTGTKSELHRMIFDTKEVHNPVEHFRRILQPKKV